MLMRGFDSSLEYIAIFSGECIIHSYYCTANIDVYLQTEWTLYPDHFLQYLTGIDLEKIGAQAEAIFGGPL